MSFKKGSSCWCIRAVTGGDNKRLRRLHSWKLPFPVSVTIQHSRSKVQTSLQILFTGYHFFVLSFILNVIWFHFGLFRCMSSFSYLRIVCSIICPSGLHAGIFAFCLCCSCTLFSELWVCLWGSIYMVDSLGNLKMVEALFYFFINLFFGEFKRKGFGFVTFFYDNLYCWFFLKMLDWLVTGLY